MSATDQTPLETPPIEPIPMGPIWNLPPESFDPTPFDWNSNYTPPFQQRIYDETNIWFPKRGGNHDQVGGSRAMYHDNREPNPFKPQPIAQVGGFMVQPEPAIPFGPKLYGASYEQPKPFAFAKKGPLGPGQKVVYPDAKYQMNRKPMEERFLAHKSGFAQVLK